MAVITSYASLQTAIADWLNRSDLTTMIPNFIQNAEERFQRDPRVRDPANNAVLVPLRTTDPNWLLTAHPDIYLYASLVESAPFIRDDERVALWEAELEHRLQNLAGSVRLDPARSLDLTSYANLQTMVADALGRGDLKTVIPVCVTLAEAKLAKDRRVRNLSTATYSITGDDIAVPSGFRTLESWYHDGDTYFGDIQIVGAGELGNLKGRYGTSGPPAYAAILNGTFRFAPAPGETYSTKMTYWQGLTALSAGANWLFTGHPDVYMYATMIEAEPWLDDAGRSRIPGWSAKLEGALENLHQEVWDDQWSGALHRQFDPIG